MFSSIRESETSMAAMIDSPMERNTDELDGQTIRVSFYPPIRESQQKILAHDANLVEQFYRNGIRPEPLAIGRQDRIRV